MSRGGDWYLELKHHEECTQNRGHHITNPNNAPLRGNPPSLPYIYIGLIPLKMDNLMIPAKNPPDFGVIECPTTSIQQPFLNLNIDWHHRATKKNGLFHLFFPIAFLPRLAPRSGFRSSAQFRGVVEKRVLRAGGFDFFGFVKLNHNIMISIRYDFQVWLVHFPSSN